MCTFPISYWKVWIISSIINHFSITEWQWDFQIIYKHVQYQKLAGLPCKWNLHGAFYAFNMRLARLKYETFITISRWVFDMLYSCHLGDNLWFMVCYLGDGFQDILPVWGGRESHKQNPVQSTGPQDSRIDDVWIQATTKQSVTFHNNKSFYQVKTEKLI